MKYGPLMRAISIHPLDGLAEFYYKLIVESLATNSYTILKPMISLTIILIHAKTKDQSAVILPCDSLIPQHHLSTIARIKLRALVAILITVVFYFSESFGPKHYRSWV
jgi:hypothetical protein